jgi:Xaa-Pro dipeptidase
MRLFISREEHLRRTAVVRAEARRRNLDALVLFGPLQIFYLTGFAFIATERPMALIVTGDATVLFVPRLEEEHAAAEAAANRVVTYPEYPTETHPMHRLTEQLIGLGLVQARLGADSDGYPGIMGYRGPRLSEVLPRASVRVVRDLIEDTMKVKGPEEIALIRESARWGISPTRCCRSTRNPASSRARSASVPRMRRPWRWSGRWALNTGRSPGRRPARARGTGGRSASSRRSPMP